MKRRLRLAWLAFASTTALVPADAFAYTFTYTCNGCPGTPEPGQTMLRNSYSIGNNTTRYYDMLAAFQEWINGSVTSTYPIVLGSATTTHSTINTSDGLWDIAVVNRSFIEGANGKTFESYGACVIGCNDLDEADLTVASDLFFGNPDESGWDVAVGGPLSARDVFVHELGHVLGLGHEPGFDVMYPGGIKPRVGGTDNHSTPVGDDRKGIAAIYGNPASFKNLAASAIRHVSGANTTTTYAGTINVQVGTIVDMQYTLLNNGTQNLTFDWREHLNTCWNCYAGGVTWTNWTGAIVNHRNGITVARSGPTPITLACNTTYWTFHTVDSGSTHAESREFDNSVHHALTLRRICI